MRGSVILRRQFSEESRCTLLFPSGTPMLLGGDEFTHTQQGNNNTYCQDNEISWFDWNRLNVFGDVQTFVKKLIAFTKQYTVLKGRKYFQGTDLDDDSVADMTWFGADLGQPLWTDSESRILCYRLDGGEMASTLADYTLFVIFNSNFNVQVVKLPPADGKSSVVSRSSIRAGQEGMTVLTRARRFCSTRLMLYCEFQKYCRLDLASEGTGGTGTSSIAPS